MQEVTENITSEKQIFFIQSSKHSPSWPFHFPSCLAVFDSSHLHVVTVSLPLIALRCGVFHSVAVSVSDSFLCSPCQFIFSLILFASLFQGLFCLYVPDFESASASLPVILQNMLRPHNGPMRKLIPRWQQLHSLCLNFIYSLVS